MTRRNPFHSAYAKDLALSWKEGIAASLMVSVTDYYVIPLALFLGATASQIGLLVAIPHLFGSISQFLAVHAVRLLGNRLRFLVHGTFLQAIILIPIAMLPLMAIPQRIELMIVLMTFFRITGNLVGTVWGSLMSDYLSPAQRGKYFGWRSQVCGIAGVTGLISGGLLLFMLKDRLPVLSFVLLFVFISAARFISSYLMSRMEEVPLTHSKEDDFTFYQFLRQFRSSNFVKFVLYVACITFATHLSAPYFSVHMLKNLKLDYLTYMIVHLSSLIGGLVAFPIWGRHADHFGNAKILKITSWLIPVIPVAWVLAPHPLFLIPIEMTAGFIWGGFNLCTVNFIFDAVSPEKRVRCFSYFTFINGMALFLGASLGAFLIGRLPPVMGHRIFTLFLISAFLRFLAHFFLSRRFREVRADTPKVRSAHLFFSVMGFRPLLGRNRDWGMVPFSKKTEWQ